MLFSQKYTATILSTIAGIISLQTPEAFANPTPDFPTVSDENVILETSKQSTLPTSGSICSCAEALAGIAVENPNLSLETQTTENFFLEAQETSPELPLDSPSDMGEDDSEKSSSTDEVEDESNKWHFKIQPYMTLPLNTYGTATVKGRSLDYHLGLGDIFDKLKFTVSGRMEAWKGNLGFIVDAYYIKLEDNGTVEFSRPRLQASLDSKLTFNQGIYDFALSYHFGAPAQYSLPKTPSNREFPLVWFEPIAGARLNDLSSTLDSELTLGILNKNKRFNKEVTKGRTWFEPMLGGKLGVQVSDPVTFWVRGDVSGFGLAGDTDLSWNVLAGVDWWVARKISLQFAYRFYHIDYGNGSGKDEFRFEQNFNGPLLSASFYF